MPFGNLTAQTVVYEPRSPGKYTRASVAFGNPDNSFIIRGASQLGADPMRASISRVLQKDIIVAGATVRKTATATLSIVVPPADFTPVELDSLVTDISEVITANVVTRMFMGES